MTLTDTGPLVALVNQNNPNHARCVTATKSLPRVPLVTTWPCFTEAMYLADRDGGYPAQAELWQMLHLRHVTLHDLAPVEIDRMAELMDKYRDLPMDLADASLIAAAEQLHCRRLFTVDSDFRVYRQSDGTVLDIVP